MTRVGSDSGGREAVVLRLYVAGQSPNSTLALAKVRSQLLMRPEAKLEVVDVLVAPEKAAADGILVTPTLVLASRTPAARIIGNLASVEDVFTALGI
jgi:hypothetical protein